MRVCVYVCVNVWFSARWRRQRVEQDTIAQGHHIYQETQLLGQGGTTTRDGRAECEIREIKDGQQKQRRLWP